MTIPNNYKRSSDNVVNSSNLQKNYRRNNITYNNNTDLKTKINNNKCNNPNSNISSYVVTTRRKNNILERKLTNDSVQNRNNRKLNYSSFTLETRENIRNLKYSNFKKN